jgi:hypothetical protein
MSFLTKKYQQSAAFNLTHVPCHLKGPNIMNISLSLYIYIYIYISFSHMQCLFILLSCTQLHVSGLYLGHLLAMSCTVSEAKNTSHVNILTCFQIYVPVF